MCAREAVVITDGIRSEKSLDFPIAQVGLA